EEAGDGAIVGLEGGAARRRDRQPVRVGRHHDAVMLALGAGSRAAPRNSTARRSAQNVARHGGPSMNPTWPPRSGNSARSHGDDTASMSSSASGGTNGSSRALISSV